LKARIVAATIALALLVPLAALAVSLQLGGPTGPEGARIRRDATLAVYASAVDGKTVLLTEVGATAPGGGLFSEFGVPSVTPDGHILFAAEVSDEKEHGHWDIFTASPNAAPNNRVARALAPKTQGTSCSPNFKGDPYPVGDALGEIAFMAPEAGGHDALFLYNSSGSMRCLARVGDRTTGAGNQLAVLGFGTAQMGESGHVVFNAWLNGDRQALLIASVAGGVRELAAEGELGPNRIKYVRPFSLPAAVAPQNGSNGTTVAFTAHTSSGAALFLYRDGSMVRALPTGTLSPLGPVSYLSTGRPGLNADGTIAVLAGCARVPAVFQLIHGRLDLSLQRGQVTPFGTALVSLGDPALTESGTMYLGAIDSEDNEKLYIMGGDHALFEAGASPIYNIAFGPDEHHHSIFTGTLAVNQHGDFAYLGGK
jgi:hypothetical protein